MAVSAEAVFDRIETVMKLIGELEPILQSLMLNDSTIIDGLAQMLGTMQTMATRAEQRTAGLTAEVRSLAADLAYLNTAHNKVPSPADRFEADNPEIELVVHLLPYLPSPIAVDAGANVGSVAMRLVGAGFEVFAFEPFAASFAALQQKAATEPRLHPHQCALGAADGSAQLLIASDTSEQKTWDTSLYHSLVPHPMLHDLKFEGSQPVPVRSLASLMRSGEIPSDAAVLKIDTEGMDLDVIRGAAPIQFAVIVAEFWDAAHPFGRAGHGELSALVTALRAHGYLWHVVIYRVDETNTLGFYCGGRDSIAKSWGNIAFFNRFDLYARAVSWCDAHLHRAADTNRNGV